MCSETVRIQLSDAFKYHLLTRYAPALVVYTTRSYSKGKSESEMSYTHGSNSQPLLSQQQVNCMGCAQVCMYSHNHYNASNYMREHTVQSIRLAISVR